MSAFLYTPAHIADAARIVVTSACRTGSGFAADADGEGSFLAARCLR